MEVEGLSANASTTPTMASKIAATTQPQIHRSARRARRRGFLREKPNQPDPHRWQCTTPHHPTTPHPMVAKVRRPQQVMVYG